MSEDNVRESVNDFMMSKYVTREIDWQPLIMRAIKNLTLTRTSLLSSFLFFCFFSSAFFSSLVFAFVQRVPVEAALLMRVLVLLCQIYHSNSIELFCCSAQLVHKSKERTLLVTLAEKVMNRRISIAIIEIFMKLDASSICNEKMDKLNSRRRSI